MIITVLAILGLAGVAVLAFAWSLRGSILAGPAFVLELASAQDGAALLLTICPSGAGRKIIVESISIDRAAADGLGIQAPGGFVEKSLIPIPREQFEADLEELGENPTDSSIGRETERQYREHLASNAAHSREVVRYEGRLALARGSRTTLRFPVQRLADVSGKLLLGYRCRIGVLSQISGQSIALSGIVAKDVS